MLRIGTGRRALPRTVPSAQTAAPMMDIDIVVPSIGRPSLARLLDGLGQVPARIIVVDDRRIRAAALPLGRGGERVTVRCGRSRGPAAARNVGWRATSS